MCRAGLPIAANRVSPGSHRTHRSPCSKTLQDPQNVAETMRYLLRLPADTAVPEMTVTPMPETSWP